MNALSSNERYEPSANTRTTTSKQVVVKTKEKVDDKFHHQVKKSLREISRSNSEAELAKRISELILCIEKHPIKNWNWQLIIDRITLNSPVDNLHTARYRALIAILKMGEIASWLNCLRQRELEYQSVAFNLQKNLLQTSKKHPLVYRQLLVNLDQGITQILLSLTPSPLNQSTDIESRYEDIVWLLVRSSNLWNSYFRLYSSNLIRKILIDDVATSNDFCKHILQILPHSQPLPEYKIFANLFAELKNYSLAALFYQLADGYVSAIILEHVHVAIIPLKQQPKIAENQQGLSQRLIKVFLG